MEFYIFQNYHFIDLVQKLHYLIFFYYYYCISIAKRTTVSLS